MRPAPLSDLGDVDPYQLLGVPTEATREQILLAHRKRIRTTHPDLTGGDEEPAKLLNLARDVLLNPDWRAEYDASVAQFEIPDVVYTATDAAPPDSAPPDSAYDSRPDQEAERGPDSGPDLGPESGPPDAGPGSGPGWGPGRRPGPGPDWGADAVPAPGPSSTHTTSKGVADPPAPGMRRSRPPPYEGTETYPRRAPANRAFAAGPVTSETAAMGDWRPAGSAVPEGPPVPAPRYASRTDPPAPAEPTRRSRDAAMAAIILSVFVLGVLAVGEIMGLAKRAPAGPLRAPVPSSCAPVAAAKPSTSPTAQARAKTPKPKRPKASASSGGKTERASELVEAVPTPRALPSCAPESPGPDGG
jgi:hypothetical protein